MAPPPVKIVVYVKVDGRRARYLSLDVIKVQAASKDVKPMGDSTGVTFYTPNVSVSSACSMIDYINKLDTYSDLDKQPLTVSNAETIDFPSVLRLFTSGYKFGISHAFRGEDLFKELRFHFKMGSLSMAEFKMVHELVYFEGGLFATMLRAVTRLKLVGRPLPETRKMEEYLRACRKTKLLSTVEQEVKNTLAREKPSTPAAPSTPTTIAGNPSSNTPKAVT